MVDSCTIVLVVASPLIRNRKFPTLREPRGNSYKLFKATENFPPQLVEKASNKSSSISVSRQERVNVKSTIRI